MIQTIKEQWVSTTDYTLAGYLVDGLKAVPLAPGNRDYDEVQRAIAGTGEYINNTIVPTPAYTQQEIDDTAVDLNVAEAKANIAMTDVAMTVDMFQKMSKQEQEAMTAYREKNLDIIQGGQVTPSSRMVNAHLQSAFGKFKIK